MTLLASLGQLLARLCENPTHEPKWLLGQLWLGVRETYGAMAIGFIRPDREKDWRVMGLVDSEGRVLVHIPSDFQTRRSQPQLAFHRTDDLEVWFNAEEGISSDDSKVAETITSSRSVFRVPWLVDRPSDWEIVVFSPIAAPSHRSQDRNFSMVVNLLATSLLRAMDACRLDRANAWIHRELDEINRLQRLLLPESLDGIQGIEVAVHAEIFQYAGGDYYDVPVLTHLVPEDCLVEDRDHWGAIVADVSGHGPSAAVETAMLDAIMRTYPGPVDAGPANVLGYLNRYLFTKRPRAAFVTAFVCNYWPNRNQLIYSNAGHPPALMRKNGQSEWHSLDQAHGIPLRVDQHAQWEDCSLKFDHGDTLLIFSDGIVEVRNSEGEMWGVEGLLDALNTAPTEACAIKETVLDALAAFSDHREISDDQTMVVIRTE